MSLLDTTQFALEAAMSGSMQRQALLTNNLANVDTPGYQRQDVNFQGTLDQAMQSGQTGQALDQVTFRPVTQQQTVRADGNGVDASQESANIAENGLLYQELAQIAAAREGILKSAMGTG
jgi:flagellar basal-body rod protein FlgB